MAEARDDWAKRLSQCDGVDKGLFFGEIFRAEFGEIKDHIILYHVEGVILKAQHIALLDEFQRFQRVDVVHSALPGEQILDDSYRLNVFVCFEVGTHQRIDYLQLGLAVFDLVQEEEMLVEVNQLFVVRLQHEIQDLR